MRYLDFGTKNEYKFLFLVQTLQQKEFEKYYLQDIPKEDSLFIELYKDPTKKKTSASDMKQFFNEDIVPIIKDFNVQYLLVCDAEYFKVLVGETKAEPFLGYCMKNKFCECKTFYVPPIKAIFYNPELVHQKIKTALYSALAEFNGNYVDPGSSIIRFQYYPKTVDEIKNALENLIEKNVPLTCDIETFSLKHYEAGLASITFCWNKHDGIAFSIDNHETKEPNLPVRQLLKSFFERFSQKLIFHNIAFDAKVLIYQLFMNSLTDTKGLLEGIKTLMVRWEDTKLITYLATNSCSRTELGLKAQSQEYSGNYAQDEIGDVTKIPEDELLRYNLIDGLSTWYVYEKYWQKMIDDRQLDIYTNIFKPATIDIIQMELTGLPIDMNQVAKVKEQLQKDQSQALAVIQANIYVLTLEKELIQEYVDKRNSKLKVKKISPEDVDIHFNPNSGDQVRKLLYEELKLPVINTTDTGQPATDSKTIKDLLNRTDSDNVKELLNAFLDYSAVNKILSAFIPAFEKAQLGNDQIYHLFGNLNLGGTVSGRLSSSEPNLQNIPATGSKYAKLIKSCFRAPEGWLFVGLDFSALEDHINALVTKDPNKLGVYIHGYDGHCLRAYYYFRDQLKDIEQEYNACKTEEERVKVINSIKKRYKALRQESKGPTFCLTYCGTYHALMNIFGFDEIKAKQIEKSYHELYKESDRWMSERIKKASSDGYATGAFGLRVRTPILKQSLMGVRVTPKEAHKEAKVVGNAIGGQSYGLLTNRSCSEVMNIVRNSKYKYDIKPCVHIHDAQYYLIKDDPELVCWFNKILVNAVEWQEAPELKHPVVKLTGDLSIFWPDWAHELTLPHNISEEDLIKLVENYTKELNNGKA